MGGQIGYGNPKAGTGTLTDAVTVWATPTARDERGPAPAHRQGGSDLSRQVHTRQRGERMSRATINPHFCEWLQGLPRGYSLPSVSAVSATEIRRYWSLMLSELSRLGW